MHRDERLDKWLEMKMFILDNLGDMTNYVALIGAEVENIQVGLNQFTQKWNDTYGMNSSGPAGFNATSFLPPELQAIFGNLLNTNNFSSDSGN